MPNDRDVRRRTVIGLTVALVLGLRWLTNGDAGDPVADATPDRPAERTPERSPERTSGHDGLVVTSVTDGDTLVVSDGRTVRLAQVDADETHECFGSEATEALRERTLDKRVTLRRTASGPARDRYGRTLADVIVDGESVNEALVRDGAAGWYESFAHEDPDLAERLAEAERDARDDGRGMWSQCRGGA